MPFLDIYQLLSQTASSQEYIFDRNEMMRYHNQTKSINRITNSWPPSKLSTITLVKGDITKIYVRHNIHLEDVKLVENIAIILFAT